MPTFDFRCLSCEAVFEHMVPFGKKATPVCPSCGKKKTEKLLTPPAVVFKGAGWYKTDSRPAQKAAPAKPAEKTPTTEAAPASDAKKTGKPAPTESKPARTEQKKSS